MKKLNNFEKKIMTQNWKKSEKIFKKLETKNIEKIEWFWVKENLIWLEIDRNLKKNEKL